MIHIWFVGATYEQRWASEFGDFVTNGGFGNLEKNLKTDPSDVDESNRETIPVPDGMTESEFVEQLETSFESYDNSANYELIPNEPGEGNSNSLVGSVIKKAGSDFKPSRRAIGYSNDVFVKPKPKRSVRGQQRQRELKRRKG